MDAQELRDERDANIGLANFYLTEAREWVEDYEAAGSVEGADAVQGDVNLDRVAKFATIANAFAQTALALHARLEMQIETDRTLSRQAGYRQL